jgi:hypothetical protein
MVMREHEIPIDESYIPMKRRRTVDPQRVTALAEDILRDDTPNAALAASPTRSRRSGSRWCYASDRSVSRSHGRCCCGLLWLSPVALRRADMSAPAVQATISLVLAWIGVRLATSLIASPFWLRAIAIVVVATAALRVFGLWSATLHILDEMTMTIGAVRLTVLGLIEATVILTILWAVVDRSLDRLPDLTPSGRVLLGKMLRIAALSIAVVVALHAIASGPDDTGGFFGRGRTPHRFRPAEGLFQPDQRHHSFATDR